MVITPVVAEISRVAVFRNVMYLLLLFGFVSAPRSLHAMLDYSLAGCVIIGIDEDISSYLHHTIVLL